MANRPKRKIHPLFKWLRTASFTAELFGWGGLMLGGWFWTGAIFIYLGFFLVAADLWVEPDLQGRMKLRVLGLLVIGFFAAAFSWAIVFVKAPLEISANMTDAEYPIGSAPIAGITWRPEFTEVVVRVANTVDRNYDDINLLIRPSDAIAAIAQITSVPNVSFEDNHAGERRLMDINGRTKKVGVVPLDLLATDAGYRMHCPHLPAHSDIRIEIALADIRWDPVPSWSEIPSPEELARDRNYMLREKHFDFSTYWWGHTDGHVYAPRPTSTDWIKVEGQYTVAQRTRSISLKINVGGKLTIRGN